MRRPHHRARSPDRTRGCRSEPRATRRRPSREPRAREEEERERPSRPSQRRQGRNWREASAPTSTQKSWRPSFPWAENLGFQHTQDKGMFRWSARYFNRRSDHGNPEQSDWEPASLPWRGGAAPAGDSSIGSISERMASGRCPTRKGRVFHERTKQRDRPILAEVAQRCEGDPAVEARVGYRQRGPRPSKPRRMAGAPNSASSHGSVWNSPRPCVSCSTHPPVKRRGGRASGIRVSGRQAARGPSREGRRRADAGTHTPGTTDRPSTVGRPSACTRRLETNRTGGYSTYTEPGAPPICWRVSPLLFAARRRLVPEVWETSSRGPAILPCRDGKP